MIIHYIINEIPKELCGAEKIVEELSCGLKKKGISSTIFTLTQGGGDVCSRQPIKRKSPYVLKSFMRVYNYIKNNCIDNDIIHAHLFPTMLYVSIAVKILRWKGIAVCTEHSTHNRRRGTRLGKIIDRITYSGYKTIFCISEGVRKELAEWLPEFSDRMTVVENGIDLQFNEFYKRKKNNRLVIVSVGRLHKLKNYESALHALSRMDNIDFEYRIAGTGDEQESLKRLCIELEISNRVKFYGYVDDIAGFLKQADIFLITSLWEGFGLSTVEAMNAGLPIIASDVPGLREIVNSENKCGILVNPTELDEFAAAIVVLLDWDKRIQLGRNAFKRSLGFSKERMIDGYVAGYEKICLQPLH